MEPLAFIAAILGAGGLGVILKITLSSSSRAQNAAYSAIERQRAGFEKTLDQQRIAFEKFLTEHMIANRQAMEDIVEAVGHMGDSLLAEHKETRALILQQETRVRDAHRRMAIALTQARTTSGKVGKALDKVMDENGAEPEKGAENGGR